MSTVNVLSFENEHKFEKDEVVTLHIVEILDTIEGKAGESAVIIARGEVLGPPVPVEGKLKELAEVNKELTDFVKSIADMRITTWDPCPYCKGWQEHKDGCLYIRAVKLII